VRTKQEEKPLSEWVDKQNRFERFIQHVGVTPTEFNAFFKDGFIERVETSKSIPEWKIFVKKKILIPSSPYRSLCQAVSAKFPHITKLQLIVDYNEAISDSELVEMYWPNFVEWAQTEVVSINGWLAKAKIEVTSELITIILLDTTALELAKKRDVENLVRSYYNEHFSREFRVTLEVSASRVEEYERFQAQIVAEEIQFKQELISESTLRFAKNQISSLPENKWTFGYEIKDIPIPIQKIQEEEKKVIIQGSIFQLDVKELRNGSTLFQFSLTDFSESIQCKCFAKTKEDVKILNQLGLGNWVRIRGRVEYDRFMQEPDLVVIVSDINEAQVPEQRHDDADEKRVEFHLHTTMSTMDAVSDITEYVQLAAKWGHKALAVTDHANVQSFPEAAKAAKKYGIKMIYGIEANVLNDGIPIVHQPDDRELSDATYVIYDVETTGLSVTYNKIIELAGVKMKNGKIIAHFSEFINPHEAIPQQITQLTNITNEMVSQAPEEHEVISRFVEWIGDCVLVAHNARFDSGFLDAACKRHNILHANNPVVDSLELARWLYPNMKNHRLNTLADKFKVSLENHHRAIDDAQALSEIVFHMLKEVSSQNMIFLSDLNRNIGRDLSNVRPFHCNIYALNAIGKKNLYKLVSISHTQYFQRVPCIPKSKLEALRDGLWIGSGCEKGEFFETVLNKSFEEAQEVARFYDFFEIQPLTFYQHLVDKGLVAGLTQIQSTILSIVEIGRNLGKPVIATGNVHYAHPHQQLFREITIHGITGFSPLKDLRKPDAHFRTTNEMLGEFAFLNKEIAYDVVVRNTIALAERFELIELFPDQLYTPLIEGADAEIRNKCYETARRLYGDPIPEVVEARLEKELQPIIKYGFSANYLISERLVKKSNEDGYLVGSRGSVGSSIVATFLGISEVNPLPAHYLCRSCLWSEWFLDGSVPSGFDLPSKACPRCTTAMKGEGQDIPFETFLGFKGDKVPDIDLNFSGEYQPQAHNYTKILFGERNVFRAGTIGTVAEKTAFGFVKKYEEDKNMKWRSAEEERLAIGCTGVKRSTGQHPGGIVVVPEYIDVEDITPVQYPADDTSSEWKTTHFDYHAFDANLLKLDILGHDDPTMMRMLQDLTGVDPTSIPMNDSKVMSIFSSTETIGVSQTQIRTPVATYGVPEMGTRFVRQMLEETQPKSFADLLQISGLSHGTGVWLGNAQDLIKNGICTIKTVIGCRDDIMLFLIYKAGMDAALAFKITESVRKGKGLTDEWIQEMKNCGVPQWYIDSCLRIEYMFPKAHAAAYVISAVRTAYFKVYYPIYFYATYFTVRAEDIELDLLTQGYAAIHAKISEIEGKGFQASTKERNSISSLEIALEMTARGFTFSSLDLARSDARKFLVEGNTLIPPFSAVAGIGENAARNIAAARGDGPFLSIEDFQSRSRATKTVIELLTTMGCFRGLPDSNQLALF
jgi:DNA polymerase-3 subunit alpha (Gram-positive type)